MIQFTRITPLIIGACSGILYGCSFLFQQRGIFFAQTTSRSRIQQLVFFLVRILILIGTGHYLLRSAVIPSILSSIAFFGMFWFVIIVVKAQLYERI